MISIRELLKKNNLSAIKKVKQIKFSGVGNKNVYNITAPFKYKKTTYIIGRVEPTHFETSFSYSVFFKKCGNCWKPDESCPKFILEDPFITTIHGLFILGGVEVQVKNNKLIYRTVFHKGSDIHNLKKFTAGPWGMKDIRLVELPNNEIGVFTRPQGKKGRRGKIGFTKIDSLKNLTPRKISKAELIKNQFSRGEWGGVNEAIILKNKKIGVLGHIARYSKDKKNRFYYPIAFFYDYEKNQVSPIKILVKRGELPEGESKLPGFYNVVFPGGIIREKGLAKIYAGVGDAESYEIIINDPFLEYEKEDNLNLQEEKIN